jgi:hypothetical protein
MKGAATSTGDIGMADGMTTNDPKVNAAAACSMLASLLVRSVSLATGVGLAFLLAAAFF